MEREKEKEMQGGSRDAHQRKEETSTWSPEDRRRGGEVAGEGGKPPETERGSGQRGEIEPGRGLGQGKIF